MKTLSARLILQILLYSSLFISCGEKEEIVPTDKVIDDFKKKLIGKWNCLVTQSMVGGDLYGVLGEVDCQKENQWDYLKSLNIASDLAVTNEYYCTTEKITHFEILRQKNVVPNNTFIIVEKDDDGMVKKIYQVIDHIDPNTLSLAAYLYDKSDFHLTNVGTIPSYPSDYTILIEKQ